MTDGNDSSRTSAALNGNAERFVKALGFALLPIAGLLVSLKWGSSELKLMELRGCTFTCAGDPLERAAPELLWAGGFGLLCVVSVTSVVVGTLAINRYTEKSWTLLAIPVLVIGLALAAGLQKGPFVQMLSWFGETCSTLKSHFYHPKTIGEAGASALGLAMCATVLFAKLPSPRDVAQRIVHLRVMLYLGTALFVLALLVIRSAYAYVLTAASCPTDVDGEQASAIATAGAVYAGLTYSLLLAAFFVPARILLDKLGSALIPGDRADESARNEWMRQQGLSFTGTESVWEFASVLSPVLSTILFDFL